MNRLSHEKSPYLLQHQHNPVWWQPWDTQALAQSVRENKPIFLSIGYSTCHWCHVMEHESFVDPQVADFLNQHFVAIKVDREERPDLDDIYMTAVQQMTGQGGWPMSVWLTPERKPFFGGTYFPKAHFLTLLKRTNDVWTTQPEKLARDGEQVRAVIEQISALPPTQGEAVGSAASFQFLQQAGELFEAQYGGFGRAPKFPQAMTLMALMRFTRRLEGTEAEAWVVKTLDGMHRGGMYDHLSGGFHRYSTDEKWLVPHFEKMLYDNALLALTYTEAYQYFGDTEYARVADETLQYVQREMTHPEGGFFSAQDADSYNAHSGHKEEGYFATFSYSELERLLSRDELERLQTVYGITREGHYEGRNILHLAASQSRESQSDPVLSWAFEKLRGMRGARPAPHLDDKIITEWNGLMIAAFAKAAQVFGNASYLLSAQRAARFVLHMLRGPQNQLWRRWREGYAGVNAYAEDYTALIHGLLHLYESDFNVEWLQAARQLQETLDSKYWDTRDGGYFRDNGDDHTLLVRIKDDYDGVTPTANSLACLNLLRLHGLTFESNYREQAEKILVVFQPILEKAPVGLAQMMVALDFALEPAKEIALIRPQESDDWSAWLTTLRTPFLPNQVIAVGAPGATEPQLLVGKTLLQNQITAYVCKNHVCQAPTIDRRAAERMAGHITPLKPE